MKQQALQLLQQALDNPTAQFRDGQWEAIEGLVVHRRRLLVVQRTGWGKSIVYFIATRLLRNQGTGPTIIISPLLALIRNQVLAAERLGLQARSINSDNKGLWEAVEAEFKNGVVDLLLISPERLANERFRENILAPTLNRQGLGLFVVDEAHCISDWGHDFRPDYRRITRLIQALPKNVPVLATTATANNRVVNDIKLQLGETLTIVRGSLVRSSLRLQNIVLPDMAERMAWLAHYIPKLPGSGIVYTLTRKDADRLARWLQSYNITAAAYYADNDSDIPREDLERMLLNNELKVLVATTALGMGFDKPDLGFVIHFQRPGSVVHYYQQVGRAGRAVEQAYGILLSGAEDDDIINYFIEHALPPQQYTEAILHVLDQADGLKLSEIQIGVNIPASKIDQTLKILTTESPAPVQKIGSTWHRTPVHYQYDRQKVNRLIALRKKEQQQMTNYVHSPTCLMAFLQQALDDPHPTPCGRCAPCRGKPIISQQIDPADVARAAEFLAREHPPIEPRKRWPTNETFRYYQWTGFNIEEELCFETGYALCRWGDPGWGKLVKKGKQQDNYFSPALVKGTLKMLQEHWQPSPPPQWVTCVPSLNHTDLVPDFAKRLANALNLPFVEAIKKIKGSAPQKEMQNSFQQAHNLDGVFAVTLPDRFRYQPVLLVDDMVDSRWTMTVIAALLRDAGSGPVYPLALADTSRGS